MKIRKTLCAIKTSLWAALLAPVLAVAAPNMYLNQAEIDAISSKVSGNVEPWSSAYTRVMSAANSALNGSMLSVTFQGKTSNQYYTEKPYCGWPDGCRDGQINPDADRGDYAAAIALGDMVRDLGLAYAFTGEAKYADKAIDFIRVWSLDPATRMTPTTAAGNRIELFITLPGYFYGADLIWNYGGWEASEKAAFADWVKKVGDHGKANGAGLNNFANWRVVLIASAGALLDDSTLLDFAATEWKRLVPLQMNGSGKMGYEVSRSKGLHYSLYAVNAMIQGAEILRHRNINLYDYSNSGKGLELALDYITPYAIDPASWASTGYQQIITITQNDSMAMYELAYSYYQKQSYLDAIDRWKRPMDEIRTMGITTLTHANRFDLTLTPTPPSITTQPVPVTATEGEDASFSVAVVGSGSLSYQWFRGGVEIPGETTSSYTLSGVSSLDNGAVFSCEVSNSLGSVSSSGAILTVLSDTTAPTLVSAVAASDTRVDVTFSEAVSASSAGNSTNYQIDLGIAVSAANLSADGRSVSLTVSLLTAGTAYTVSVSNVQDRAQSPNTIVDLSNQTFTYLTADNFEDGTAEGWTPLTANRWSVVMDEGDQAYYLNTSNYSNSGNGRLGEYSLLSADFGNFTLTAQAKLGDDVASNGFADYAVVFGFQDDDNYYYALFNNEQSATQLFKVVNGNRTELATASSDWLIDNLYHSIEVSRAGNEIKVRFDGNLILSASDSALGTGKVGVGSFNDSAYFDDVSVIAGATTGGDPADNIAPTITLIGTSPQTITVGSAYSELGASAMDNVDGDISANITIDASAVDVTMAGTYSVTYNVSDAAGNAATEVIRTVNVTVGSGGDNVTPVITLIGNSPQTITVGSAYSELGASAMDNVDGDISANITIDASAVDVTTAGTYSVTYNVSDAAGNAATEVIRAVSVTAALAGGSDGSGGGALGGWLLALMVAFGLRRRLEALTCR